MKKALAMIVALVMALTLAVPVMALSVNETTIEPDEASVDGFAFHCNCDGGNERTYLVDKAKDFGKKIPITLLRNEDDPTIWNVVVPDDDEWVCIACGCTEWITFSNKNGVPDGKNIQLYHPAKGTVVEPIVFDITVFHKVVDSGNYLVYPGVGENFESTDEDYIEWLNDVEGFEFLNLYLAATRNNDPASLSSVEGYVCSSVEATAGSALFNFEQKGIGENISALIKPVKDGHYEVTFWYVAK